jgi:hypothetical protein
MRRSLIIGLVLVATACGPQEAAPVDTTIPGTTVQTSTAGTLPATTTSTVPDEPRDTDHPGWIEREWPIPEGVDPWAAVWGEPGMVVLGYAAFERDDSPVPNGLWFFDGSTWSETLVGDVTIADEWGFTPEVTDLVWFGGRYLAFLMGDATTTPGRPSVLVSGDGINWNLEYLGSAPAAALPTGWYATPESPPYPGTSAVARVAVFEGEITAAGWTVLEGDTSFVSIPVIWRSTDGLSWSTTPLPNALFDNEWAGDVAVGPLGYLVEARGPVHQSAMMWYSPDGNEWTHVGFDDQLRMLVSIAVGENAMLALMMDLEADGQPLSLWRSVGGSRWEEVDPPFQAVQPDEGWYPARLMNDRDGLWAMTVEDGETNLWRSGDGLSWTQLPSVVVPAGETMVRPYPLWPAPVIADDRLSLLATLPGRVIRWTEAAGHEG